MRIERKNERPKKNDSKSKALCIPIMLKTNTDDLNFWQQQQHVEQSISRRSKKWDDDAKSLNVGCRKNVESSFFTIKTCFRIMA